MIWEDLRFGTLGMTMSNVLFGNAFPNCFFNMFLNSVSVFLRFAVSKNEIEAKKKIKEKKFQTRISEIFNYRFWRFFKECKILKFKKMFLSFFFCASYKAKGEIELFSSACNCTWHENFHSDAMYDILYYYETCFYIKSKKWF